MPAKKKSPPAAPKPMAYSKATAARKIPSLENEIEIDFPREGERVRAGHYAVRLSAPKADGAQVSLDGLTWHECRSSVGHFWHDWAPSEPGATEIRARALKSGKPGRKIARRSCEVV